MCDINQMVELHFCTVGMLVEQLMKLNQKASVYCCGDYQFYLHISEDGSKVIIDNDTLDDEYDEECETCLT